MSYELAISPSGTITAIYDDCLSDLLSEGEAKVTRASHVEPVHQDGSTAWLSDLSPFEGPVLGPFPLRSDALAAEVAWLRAKFFGSGSVSNTTEEAAELARVASGVVDKATLRFNA